MRPTIVLVHGAFAESASWDQVIDRVVDAGHSAIAVANPLRGLAADAACIIDHLRAIEGPIVLVGHSYGGAVITNVDREAGELVGLVYVAAFAPLPGDSCFELSAVFPGRSEERRVGEEGRNRWAPWQLKKKRKKEGQG